jgi:hypothetical protein
MVLFMSSEIWALSVIRGLLQSVSANEVLKTDG